MPTADPLFALLGRLHVVVVHLPIGAAAALVAAEAAALLRRRPGPHAASFALSATGALTAAAAVVTGFAFSEARPGDFEPHRDAGLATAAAFVAATALARMAFGGRRIAAFRAAVLCAAAATGLAAWRGFALTHAEAAADILPGEGGDVVAVAAEAEPPAAVVAALRAERVHVERLGGTGDGWWLDCGPLGEAPDDAALAALLKPLAPYVVEAGFARTRAGAETLRVAASCPRLRRLDLTGVRLAPEALGALGRHPALGTLTLVGSTAGDASVAALSGLPALRRVYVFGSGLTPTGLSALRRRPGLDVVE